MKDLLKKIDKKQIVLQIKNNKALVVKVVLAILILTLFTITIGFNRLNDESAISNEKPSENEEYLEEEVKTKIIVDVSGAVVNPMVCELPPDSRVGDAIEVAGGLTKDADISNVNRAAVLEDGQKIFIPSLNVNSSGVVTSDDANDVSGTSNLNGKININTASSDELRTLNGVGPATAEKIINYRNENGGFKSIEDIKDVSGIGEKTFEKFKEDICV